MLQQGKPSSLLIYTKPQNISAKYIRKITPQMSQQVTKLHCLLYVTGYKPGVFQGLLFFFSPKEEIHKTEIWNAQTKQKGKGCMDMDFFYTNLCLIQDLNIYIFLIFLHPHN